MILVGVNMDDKDHCMTILCYLLYSWDKLIMDIGNIVNILELDEVMVALLRGGEVEIL